MTNRPSLDTRGVSPVVSVILLVAITVALSAVIGAFALDLGQQTTSGSQSSVGVKATHGTQNSADTLDLTVVSADNPVYYKVEGAPKHKLGTTGDSVTLVAGQDYSPGDKITILSGDQVAQTVSTDTTDSVKMPGSLVSHWAFEDPSTASTAIDSEGLHNGTLYNDTSFYSASTSTAVAFDGNKDYIKVGDHPEYHFGTGENFTISVWYQIPASEPNNIRLVDTWNYTSGGWMVRAWPDGLTNVRVDDSDGDHENVYANVTNVSSDPNAWHHIVITYDHGDTMYLYIDGQLLDTQDVSSLDDIQSYQNPLVFARNYQYPKGNLSDVRIYGQHLNEHEVETLYENTK